MQARAWRAAPLLDCGRVVRELVAVLRVEHSDPVLRRNVEPPTTPGMRDAPDVFALEEAGDVVPPPLHAVRTVARPLHRTLLPLVFVVGGSFLVLSDVVSRTIVRPLELPVGVITALVGVPLFALLLRRTLA